MRSDDYNALNSVIIELRQELSALDCEIEKNTQRIKEADAYVKSLKGSEPADYKIFSPRDAESIHRDEIEKICEERHICEEKNEQLSARRKILSSQIKRLEKVCRAKRSTR